MKSKGSGKDKSPKKDNTIDYKKKYQNLMLDEDSAETSPVEEILNCEPQKLETPTEIINIASPPSGSIKSEEMERQFNWVYERDTMFYNNHEQYEPEKKMIHTPDVLQDESEFIFYDRNGPIQPSPSPDISKSFQNFIERGSDPSENVREVVREFKHDRSDKKSERNRSTGSVNRTGNFEVKRQEVLKRKEMLEKERIEKLSRKIREKEQKFERFEKEKQENKFISQTFDRRSRSNRREGYSNRMSRDKANSSMSKSRDKYRSEEEEEFVTSPQDTKLNRHFSHRRFDSHDKDISPSIVYPSTSKIGYSPETPENYCPVINAHYKRDWTECIRPEDEIMEFPLNIEEQSERGIDSSRYLNSHRSSTSNLSKPKRESKNSDILHKSRSKDNLSYREIHGGNPIVKAFKNTP